ncbi:MAG: hypothetical protein QXK37_06180 [Candidatus Woesearchaeota archaeon]
MKKPVVFLMLLLVVQLVSGLGVGPAKSHITFSQGKTEEITLKIINTEQEDLKVAIYAKGELEKYISIENPIMHIKPDEQFTEFTYKINIPVELEPGLHTGEIVVLDLQNNAEFTQKDTTVIATTAVTSKLELDVPYPGKYAEARMYITAGSVNEPVQFSLPIYNFGKETIQSAYAKIEIFGATYEKIASLETNVISLEPQKEGKLLAAWLPDKMNAGSYLAIATINYDGREIRLEQAFSVSGAQLKINDISVREFRLGEIAVFNIEIESLWSEPINDVYGELVVRDKGRALAKVKTASIDIEAFSKDKLYAYWDTKGVSEGSYDIRVTVYFGSSSVEKLSEIIVATNGILVNVPTAQAAKGQGLWLGKETILTVLVIVLIIIVIVLIIINLRWMRRRAPPGI